MYRWLKAFHLQITKSGSILVIIPLASVLVVPHSLLIVSAALMLLLPHAEHHVIGLLK